MLAVLWFFKAVKAVVCVEIIVSVTSQVGDKFKWHQVYFYIRSGKVKSSIKVCPCCCIGIPCRMVLGIMPGCDGCSVCCGCGCCCCCCCCCWDWTIICWRICCWAGCCVGVPPWNTFKFRKFLKFINTRKEGNVLFNDTLNTFYGYMASDIW